MDARKNLCGFGVLLFMLSMPGFTQRGKVTTTANRRLVQSSLVSPGSPPFHLRATITSEDDPTSSARIEIFWFAPNKFRRTIESSEFSQILVVNGDKVSEKDTGDYFPLELQTLVTAMVDPQPVLDAIQPGDTLLTKANGAMKESGLICSLKTNQFCLKTRYAQYGLMEIVGTSGHPVAFTDYRNFAGKRVARLLTNAPRLGETLLTLKVTTLEKLNHPDPTLFAVEDATDPGMQIRSVVLPEAELQSLAIGPREIVWPQTLDGVDTGPASFYVSVDRSGHVREVFPLYTVNERTNDSAHRQLMTWRFKPAMKNGYPIQAEGILSFHLNTRAWGPPNPLTDSEVRKLASNIIEPDIPSGTFSAGTAYTLRVAIDSDGKLIEVIAGDGPPSLFMPCYKAISQWHFSPIVNHGEHLPYRGQIKFLFQ